MISAVIYDFGGVFMASPFEAIRLVSEEKGTDPAEALDILFGPYDDDTDHPWHQVERGELDLTSAREAIRALGRERGIDIDLFEMLKHLGSGGGTNEAMVDTVRSARAKGVKTAILTNNLAEARDFWRPLLPLDELFDAVVDSSEVGMRKPNPAIYRHTLELLGDPDPATAVFLDDFEGNVRAAEAVGMIGIVVDVDPSAAIERLLHLLGS